MAGFEGMRPGLGDAVREWRLVRFAPLYLAGIAAGAGLGLGLSTFIGADQDQPSITAPATAMVTVDPEAHSAGFALELSALELPLGFTAVIPAEQVVEGTLPVLPADLLPIMTAPPEPAPAPASIDPAVPAAPIVPASPASPAAPIAPAAPAAPAASNPVVVPKPAPAPPPPPPVVAEKPNFHVPSVSAAGITDLEQRLLNGINAERANAGLAPYAFDAGLSQIARIRSQQMADQGYFGHVDPYGYSMYTELIHKFGFGYAWAGENLAMNNYSVAESPERAVISLMNSPSHKANILAGDFYRIGVGEVTTADGRHIYAMIFLG